MLVGGEHAALVAFAESEVCEAYRSLALSLSRIVEDWPRWDRASTDDADGWLSLFGRYVTVLRLATRAAGVPPEFDALVRDVARMGNDGAWHRGLSAVMGAVADRSTAEGGAHEGAAAVALLTHAIPDGERPRAGRRVVADIEVVYREAGEPPPAWLELLKAYYSGADLPGGSAEPSSTA